MNIKFSGFIIFLILLICLVISVIFGRKTIVEKLTMIGPEPIFYDGINGNGELNGLTMQMFPGNSNKFSFIKTDSSLNTFQLPGNAPITDSKLIKKMLQNVTNSDIEVYSETDTPGSYIFMFKYNCNLYVLVSSIVFSYLTIITDLTNTTQGLIDPLSQLNSVIQNVIPILQQQQQIQMQQPQIYQGQLDQSQQQPSCGSANCMGNCPNCTANTSGNGATNNTTTTTAIATTLQPTQSNSSTTQTNNNNQQGSSGGQGTSGGQTMGNVSMDKYVLKTSIFPIDCPNCNKIGDNGNISIQPVFSKGITNSPTTDSTTTIPPQTKPPQSDSSTGGMFQANDLYNFINTTIGDNAVNNTPLSNYANSMNYYGALPDRGSTNYIPISSSFSSFAK
uniref:Uncharacterized protein n=1 Tax=viral metagenome TaxID=1070528 RepID=A0A6C0DU91_9ZZZZ